ncbi:sensor histidine kinase [Paenibacillus sp. Soil724D2]|uniref:sensor histidine kinase n=1 Tax=Paenibacillus sp. (strain Soil724D2) TaxID=1736392 RepID=UPI0007157EAB|nr:histidine kinase [Paenibacillus sp. Soil724D2]KRE40734.1 histidine kinase [Paenibacillus sp. Soil724D2]
MNKSRMWSPIQKIFHSFSLKQRIWLTFVVLITLGLMATGSIAYLIASKEIQRNALQSSQDTVNQSAQIVNERLKNIGIAVRALMFSDAFKQLMKDVQANDRSSYYKSLTSLQYVFSQVKFNDSMIDSILIATPFGDFYPTSSVRNTANSFYKSDMYEHFKQLNRGFWSKGHVDPFFTGKQRVISLVTEGVGEDSFMVYEPTNVYVVVNVKEDDLRDLFMENLTKTNKQYYFIDAKGEDVNYSDRTSKDHFIQKPAFFEQLSDQMKGSFFYTNDKKDYLVNYSRLDVKDDWMIVSVQAKDELLAKLNGIKRATTYVIIGFIILSLFITNNLTYLLLKPLYRLQRLMKRVEENDLSVRFESVYKDEVSQVGFRFNRMLDEIKQLIEDVKNRERDKRKAEIKALSAQMDPHFFYNTLNTIYCKSVLGENDDVNEMILALSQMFQLSLNGGRDLITLGDELEHVRQYLAIQQRSYENLFVCQFEVEPELLTCLVPKIMIQPLVENCILHGFKDMTSGGEIQIRVRTEGDWLYITVEDNGHGLVPEKLLQGIVHPTTSKHGYALRNIYTRLQLYFGDQQRMEITNNDLGAARIELWIPSYEGEEDFHEHEPTG